MSQTSKALTGPLPRRAIQPAPALKHKGAAAQIFLLPEIWCRDQVSLHTQGFLNIPGLTRTVPRPQAFFCGTWLERDPCRAFRPRIRKPVSLTRGWFPSKTGLNPHRRGPPIKINQGSHYLPDLSLSCSIQACGDHGMSASNEQMRS